MSTLKDYAPRTGPSYLSNAPSAAGTAHIRVAHAILDFSVDGGAVSTITPQKTVQIPKNAIILGGIVNVTTAVTSSGSATVAIGTSAGSSATALLAATAKTSLTLAALLDLVPVFTAATAVKMSAAGNITFTVGTAALTAGVIEAFVYYVVAANN